MKVFKFGGASISSVENIKEVAAIVRQYHQMPLVIIVSAMGKTTNALEKVVHSFYNGNKDEALELFNVIKQHHLTIAKFLLVTHYNKALEDLLNFFTEAEWLLHDKPVKTFDYYYDQIVCVGELLSSCIVSAYLNEAGIANQWVDVRDIISTDETFGEANVNWNETGLKLAASILPMHNTTVVTQGFIGSTSENESTTLGREGSDYTASIFANLLQAESLTIWKDVAGVMNADPKQFADASLISHLSFTEVIEMAYYGAQVIHPKTIKPLQNKNIDLHVKSFVNPDAVGTLITNKPVKNLPPIRVIKAAQVLVKLQSLDFSFVEETLIGQLFELLRELNIKPNLLQTGAITLQLCIDDQSDKIDLLAAAASALFDVQLERNLILYTIRHYNTNEINAIIKDKTVVLIQQTKETLQVLHR